MTKLEQAARQALDALEMAVSETLDYIQKNHLCGAENNHWIVQSKKASTALREALAEQTEQEQSLKNTLKAILPSSFPLEEMFGEQAEQEPVAEVVLREQIVGFGRTEERKDIQFLAEIDVGTKLYAAPVRTKDLP